MAWLSVDQMRDEILRVYPWEGWVLRVKEMSDRQVAAIYNRMLASGDLKDPEKKPDLKPTVIETKKPENKFKIYEGEQIKFDI